MRQYAREARAYWGEDSQQEVAVHAGTVTITLVTALCRGSLARQPPAGKLRQIGMRGIDALQPRALVGRALRLTQN